MTAELGSPHLFNSVEVCSRLWEKPWFLTAVMNPFLQTLYEHISQGLAPLHAGGKMKIIPFTRCLKHTFTHGLLNEIIFIVHHIIFIF